MDDESEEYGGWVRGRWYGRTENRFLFLLASLVLIIFVYPFAEELDPGDLLLRVLTTAILILSVYALLDTKRNFFIAILLLIPTAVTSWLEYLGGDIALVSTLAVFTNLAFFLFVTLVILHRILTTRTVTKDTIFGAVCVYLLFAYLWGTLYLITALAVPGSFATFYPDTAVLGTIEYGDAMYFSFVTITTCGYGDLIPVGNISRSLAMLEAATGVLFIATFVARLVALAGTGTSGKGDESQKTKDDSGKEEEQKGCRNTEGEEECAGNPEEQEDAGSG